MTSSGASRRHPFHPRSMTRPCFPAPFPVAPSPPDSRPYPSRRSSRRLRPTALNRLVPVLKGAAAVSATWQPRLYLASTPLSLLRDSSPPLSSLSPILLELMVSLFLRSLCSTWLFLFSLSVRYVLLSFGDINNAIAQALDSLAMIRTTFDQRYRQRKDSGYRNPAIDLLVSELQSGDAREAR